jgi:hypothetical protein
MSNCDVRNRTVQLPVAVCSQPLSLLSCYFSSESNLEIYATTVVRPKNGLISSRARASFCFVSFRSSSGTTLCVGLWVERPMKGGRDPDERRQAAGSTSQLLAIWRAVLSVKRVNEKKKTQRWATFLFLENSHD